MRYRSLNLLLPLVLGLALVAAGCGSNNQPGPTPAKVAAPDADSIPWLLLTVISHDGAGAFARVSSIQRIHTKGGQPPPAGKCGAGQQNVETWIPYTADYYFYAPGG